MTMLVKYALLAAMATVGNAEYVVSTTYDDASCTKALSGNPAVLFRAGECVTLSPGFSIRYLCEASGTIIQSFFFTDECEGAAAFNSTHTTGECNWDDSAGVGTKYSCAPESITDGFIASGSATFVLHSTGNCTGPVIDKKVVQFGKCVTEEDSPPMIMTCNPKQIGTVLGAMYNTGKGCTGYPQLLLFDYGPGECHPDVNSTSVAIPDFTCG